MRLKLSVLFLFTAVTALPSPWFSSLINVVDDTINAVVDVADTISETVDETVEKVVDTAGDVVDTAIEISEDIVDAVDEVVETAVDITQNTFEIVEDTIQQIPGIGHAYGAIWDVSCAYLPESQLQDCTDRVDDSYFSATHTSGLEGGQKAASIWAKSGDKICDKTGGICLDIAEEHLLPLFQIIGGVTADFIHSEFMNKIHPERAQEWYGQMERIMSVVADPAANWREIFTFIESAIKDAQYATPSIDAILQNTLDRIVSMTKEEVADLVRGSIFEAFVDIPYEEVVEDEEYCLTVREKINERSGPLKEMINGVVEHVIGEVENPIFGGNFSKGEAKSLIDGSPVDIAETVINFMMVYVMQESSVDEGLKNCLPVEPIFE